MPWMRTRTRLGDDRDSGHQRAEPLPIEGGSGVGLAAWGDVAVADDPLPGNAGIARPDLVRGSGQDPVLRRFVRNLVGPLQLDADRKVVAAIAAVEAGNAG